MSVFGSKIEDFYQSGQPKLGMSAGPRKFRLVITGKTGAGKSKTGNLILEKKDFISSCSLHSVTKPCELEIKNRFPKQICVVDTPGLIADRDDNESIQKEIKKFISLTCPAPYAIILEVSIGRFTEERVETVNRFFNTICKIEQLYKIVMFTKQGDIQEEWSVEENKRRLVKIRKSRADKSETRTTIFVKKLFNYEYSSSINPLEPINKNRFRKPLCVVIPDDGKIFDNRNDQKEMKSPFCLQSHGRHAVVQSQPIGRFTEEDEETVKYSQSYLGENLVGMILLIVTFLATIRKKKVEVLSEDALLAGHISGPVRNTVAYPVGKKSHELAIDDFEDSINTKIILDSMIISGGMEKDPNHVCKPEQKKCQMCIDRNEASYWCNTCRRNICNFCKLYHEKVWMVKNHNVQALF